MSFLFNRIHSLLRKGQSDQYEDFLTEIMAEVLEDGKKLQSFVETFLDIKNQSIQDIEVSTQKTFLKLEGHDSDSRPDLVLQFSDNDGKYVVFLENKLDSTEGREQLKRYAEHLKRDQNNGSKTFLLYITRYAESKNEDGIFSLGKTATFIQIRWYKVYEWLKNEPYDSFNKKVLEFMEGIRLDESRKFSPQDMYAMQNLNRLQHMMDECFNDVVDAEMTKLFGKTAAWSNRSTQLRDYNRYFKVIDSYVIWMGCGFNFNAEDDEYPQVQVIYSVGSAYPQRDKLIQKMKQFVEQNDDWESMGLYSDEKWQAICAWKSMLDFLHHEDHISAIQQFYIEKLRELYKLKQEDPELFWK